MKFNSLNPHGQCTQACSSINPNQHLLLQGLIQSPSTSYLLLTVVQTEIRITDWTVFLLVTLLNQMSKSMVYISLLPTLRTKKGGKGRIAVNGL